MTQILGTQDKIMSKLIMQLVPISLRVIVVH